jgi:hypothetical protein
MLMATGIKQPDFSAAKPATAAPPTPDVIPQEGITSGNLAPLTEDLQSEDTRRS